VSSRSVSDLPINARKELYSFAYASAVAASLGVEVLHIKFDFDSVDCQFFSRRAQLGLQLKATSSDCIKEDSLVFNLPIKNYNDLRDPDRYVPTMLVVLHLPPLEDLWLQFNDQDLILKNSAYFFNLVGSPASTNTESQRLRIPLRQRFNRETVRALMNHISQHKRLP